MRYPGERTRVHQVTDHSPFWLRAKSRARSIPRCRMLSRRSVRVRFLSLRQVTDLAISDSWTAPSHLILNSSSVVKHHLTIQSQRVRGSGQPYLAQAQLAPVQPRRRLVPSDLDRVNQHQSHSVQMLRPNQLHHRLLHRIRVLRW